MHEDFLRSPLGRLLAYRKRHKRKFEFWWTGKLQTKSSRRGDDDKAFQTALIQQMEVDGRKGPFTGPVLLELQYWVESRQSPAIHSLTKHYLDLLMAPVAGVDAGRSRILLRDDSQVQFLCCTYNARLREDTLRLRVRRLTDFFEDLTLYGDIVNGWLGDAFEVEGEDGFQDESHLDYWRDLKKNERKWVQLRGVESYRAWELLSRRDAQKEVLERRRLPLSSLPTLFGSKYHRLKNNPEVQSVITSTTKMLRSAYVHPVISADFGHRPVKHGDTKIFRDRVQEALMGLKNRLPVLFPLLTPCGVTIFYVPPRWGDKVDLDNLVRKAIIPAVHEILKPPATPAAFFLALEKAQPGDPNLAESLERYRDSPEFHVASYDVLCLPRLDDDPANGSVKLILHDGEADRTAWSSLDGILSDWKDHVDRSA